MLDARHLLLLHPLLIIRVVAGARRAATAGGGGWVGGAGNSTTIPREDSEADLIPQLEDALIQLRPQARQVLVLHAQGFSYEEIARATGAKLGTVGSRLHYARKRLKELIAFHG